MRTRTLLISCHFFFNDTATTEIYTLSLHDALPIYPLWESWSCRHGYRTASAGHCILKACGRASGRSEEHTSELQSRRDLVCRLLLEKKNLRPRRAHVVLCQRLHHVCTDHPRIERGE